MQVLQGSDSLFLDRMIMTFTCAWTWLPLYVALLYLVIHNNETMKQVMLLLLCTALAVAIADVSIDVFVKPLCERWRPTRDPILKYTIDVVNGYRGGKYGFFSAHAANTMTVAAFLFMVTRSKLLGFTLVGWSLLNGFTRIYLGVHYPSDVLIGWIWGAIIAVCVYLLYSFFYDKISSKRNYISTQYTSTGYAYADIFIVMCAAFVILLYVLIRALLPM